MKLKSIIACGLLLLGVGAATTSCEDMFTAENNLVTTDLAPQDTVYQVMGIVKRMQKLADRTVLLGEIRADLVNVNTSVASTDLQQLYLNNVSSDNAYNKPADYYAVINSCNIYLANVDANLKTHNELYYEKEICAVKCFRAWCYLELAKIYGTVPLVTEPVLTADAAEDIVASSQRAGMADILDFCINDLAQYPLMDKNLSLRPSYGSQTWNGITYNNFFIPVRALLAELYLWRGACEGTSSSAEGYYVNAIRMYHDYFCFPDEERGTRENTIQWYDRNHEIIVSGYHNHFSVSATMENAAVLPCDTVAYYGNVSDLRTVFNSQYANNYYAWASPSDRIRKISAAQTNCYYDRVARDTIYFSDDPNDYRETSMVGDLRYFSVYQIESNQSKSQYNGEYNSSRSWVSKWTEGSVSFLTTDVKNAYIPFFRNTVLYLHMAEALNRAGFPETAFAVLKYGLTNDVMDDRNIISQDEFDRLCDIKSYGFSRAEPRYTGDLATKANNSFVVWRSDIFQNPDNVNGTTTVVGSNIIRQIGIHSNGSGYSELNKYYYLPTDSAAIGLKDVPKRPTAPVEVSDPGELMTETEWNALTDDEKNATYGTTRYARYKSEYNTQKSKYDQYVIDYANYQADLAAYQTAYNTNAAVRADLSVRQARQAELSKMILEEEALEGMFEGQRFYDLMRYQMQEGKLGTTITMPDCVAEKYGDTQRAGMVGQPWYLTLPTR